MALKDWTKKGEDYWERKSIKRNIFRGKIGTDKIGIVETYNSQKQEYSDFKMMMISSGGGVNESKTFSTKSQALRFAKDYMKKH